MKKLTEQSHAVFDRLGQAFSLQDYMLLFIRLWIAEIFYLSGRSKVGEGFLTPSETTMMLFEEDYALPFIGPEAAAHMALYAETFLPLMLMVGLGARFGALGLLGMTLVIQVFVYPGYFPEHMTWAAALLPVIMLGAGRLSMDHLLRQRVR